MRHRLDGLARSLSESAVAATAMAPIAPPDTWARLAQSTMLGARGGRSLASARLPRTDATSTALLHLANQKTTEEDSRQETTDKMTI